MEIVLGGAMTVLGVVVGGVLQHFTSQRTIDRQHDWDRSRLLHEKLEQIAEEANDLGERMRKLYSDAIVNVDAGEPYRPEISLPFAKLEMLLNFYAPELKQDYDQLVRLRDEMGSTLVNLVNGRIPTEKRQKQELNEKLLTASRRAKQACEQLIQGASELGRDRLSLKAEQNHAADARNSRG